MTTATDAYISERTRLKIEKRRLKIRAITLELTEVSQTLSVGSGEEAARQTERYEILHDKLDLANRELRVLMNEAGAR